jgi:large subunit ribosomal protein L22
MSVQAVAKNVKMSPRKVSIVANLVRGRSVADAYVILENTPRRSADAVNRVIKSASANAEHNHKLKPDTLAITEITVTPGFRMKRYKPAARGRALPFQKKTSIIKVTVDGEKRVAKKTVAAAQEKKSSEGAK